MCGMPRGKAVVDSRSAPREPHDQREQNVRESADADLRPRRRPAGRPTNGRSRTRAPARDQRPNPTPVPRRPAARRRRAARSLSWAGRMVRVRRQASTKPAHQILRSTAPVALLRGAGRRAHVPRSTVQVSESGPAKPRDGRPAPFDGHHPRALSTTTMRRAHSWGSFRVELSCVLEALPSGLSAAGVGARGLMRRQSVSCRRQLDSAIDENPSARSRPISGRLHSKDSRMESTTGTIQAHHGQGLRLHRRARRRRILLPPVRVHEHAIRLDARRRQRDVYARPGPEGPPAPRTSHPPSRLHTLEPPGDRKAIGVRVSRIATHWNAPGAGAQSASSDGRYSPWENL